MKTIIRKSSCHLMVVATIFLNSVNAFAYADEPQENDMATPQPRYELKLNLNEFSILNSAVVAGLNKYGGDAEFKLKMTKEENEIFWMLTLSNARAVEVLSYYLAEKSADLIKTINFDNLDANSKIALSTIKSLTAKVDYAQRNPVWDLVKISGLVTEENGTWFIAGKQVKLQITGNKLADLQKAKGKPIIGHGYVKVQGQIEAVRFVEKKENTLELFVMSQCPFGKRAESSLLNYLQSYSGKTKPDLNIHYIFYANKHEGKVSYSAMHGEEEIKENVVQMLIRDRYPQYFHRYLLGRVDNHCSWENLAKELGMKDEEIKSIAQALVSERDSLIQKEYAYVTETCGIYDGSPTYVWEGERVAEIRHVERFKDMALASASTESCSN